MTNDEILALLPSLRRAARCLRGNGVDADDLVQAAALVLLEGRRQYTNPLVLAGSVMRDYVRQHGLDPIQNRRLRRVGGRALVARIRRPRGDRPLRLDDDSVGDAGHHQASAEPLDGVPRRERLRGWIWWENLGLDPDDEAAARLHYEQGLSQTEIARLWGVWQPRISDRLRRVQDAVLDRLTQFTGGDG